MVESIPASSTWSVGRGADHGLPLVPRGVAVCRESTSKASHDGNLNRPHTEAFLPLASQSTEEQQPQVMGQLEAIVTGLLLTISLGRGACMCEREGEWEEWMEARACVG